MRERKCSDLGYTCSWKHIARTEELLADVTAIHLRDIHGVESLNADMVGRIKNAFSNPAPVDITEAGGLALKEFKCEDLGTGCGWKYIAQTEELIVDGVAVHAREAHGIKEFTPELKVKVQNALHEWRG
jgi:predicted small metal-binding protein